MLHAFFLTKKIGALDLRTLKGSVEFLRSGAFLGIALRRACVEMGDVSHGVFSFLVLFSWLVWCSLVFCSLGLWFGVGLAEAEQLAGHVASVGSLVGS